MKEFSRLYRLMIYFAHSTLVMYEKDLKSDSEMTVEQFRDKNEHIIQTVFKEGLKYMNYELSINQMDIACVIYLKCKYRNKT